MLWPIYTKLGACNQCNQHNGIIFSSLPSFISYSWHINTWLNCWKPGFRRIAALLVYLLKLNICSRHFLGTLRLAYLLKSVSWLSCLADMILEVRKKGNTWKQTLHNYKTFQIMPYSECNKTSYIVHQWNYQNSFLQALYQT